jgi:hypothetical protein
MEKRVHRRHFGATGRCVVAGSCSPCGDGRLVHRVPHEQAKPPGPEHVAKMDTTGYKHEE